MNPAPAPGGEKIADRIRSLRSRTWRDLFPPRQGWLLLLTSASSYLLVACAVGTAVAKGVEAAELQWTWAWLALPRAVAADFAVYIGIAALFAGVEARWPRAAIATVPMSLAVGITAIFNAAYLLEAGEQMTWEAWTTLADRRADIAEIVAEVATRPVLVVVGAGTALGVWLPIVLRRHLRRSAGGWRHAEFSRIRTKTAAWTLAVSVAVLIAAPLPQNLDMRRLAKSAPVTTLRTLMSRLDKGSFAGYQPVALVGESTLAAVSARKSSPNVVVVVLESARYDYTSLSNRRGVASTPNLQALADRGSVAHRARAVVLHTTKSLFAILCARLPTMQKKLVELSSDLRAQCLPAMLREAGYHTAFFQSALGTFEARPRLVDLFGFDEFEAWEDIQGERLGYLGSDDESLAEAFREWLDPIATRGDRFFATLMTSATHHPYRLPSRTLEQARKAGLPIGAPSERYARLLEAKDRLLGELIGTLESHGLLDHTIVAVMGDHGEGFGDHGIKQHDNNFYEEGLRVPLVFAGPGVPAGEIPGNVSLVDVTPTLLALLDIAIDDAARGAPDGRNILAAGFRGQQPSWFGCWFERRCRGFVLGDRKVVQEPHADVSWYFDLAADPDERNPLPLTSALNAELDELNEVFDRHTARGWKIESKRIDRYGQWRCLENRGKCLHPNAKRRSHRTSERGR